MKRGFALLAVLWMIIVVGGASAALMASVRVGVAAARNRVAMTRGRWASEACMAVLQSRWRPAAPLLGGDTIDLGQGTWCHVTLEEAAARLNVNKADAEALRAVLGSDVLVDRLMDWRDADDEARPLGAESAWYRVERRPAPRNGPLAGASEIRQIAGFEQVSDEQARRLFTVEGDGRIDVNSAPLAVIASLRGMTEEGLDAIVVARRTGREIPSLDALVGSMPFAAQKKLLASYATLGTQVVFRPDEIVAYSEGGVRGERATTVVTWVLRPVGGRLVILKRMMA